MLPSEVVMIPAGYLCAKGEMSLSIVIVLGTLGSIAGALLNYFLAVKLGRKLILKYGHYIFFKPETLEKVETFFKTNGPFSTFTGIGAGLWVSILTFLGYFFGQNEALVNKHLHNFYRFACFYCHFCAYVCMVL